MRKNSLKVRSVQQCPRFTAEVKTACSHETTGGGVTLNKQNVPITKTITLQGGIIENEATGEEKFVAALNGETLSKTPQNVPGGLLDLVNCKDITGEGLLEKIERGSCEGIFENGVTGVNAVTELARPASEIGISRSNLVDRTGVALKLPVKIRLENPLLGSECYVGSSSSPIVWNLTTGTTSPPPPNKPITGKVGKITFTEEFEITHITRNSSVDNAWSAPGATGCGGIFSFLLDPIIDSNRPAVRSRQKHHDSKR